MRERAGSPGARAVGWAFQSLEERLEVVPHRHHVNPLGVELEGMHLLEVAALRWDRGEVQRCERRLAQARDLREATALDEVITIVEREILPARRVEISVVEIVADEVVLRLLMIEVGHVTRDVAPDDERSQLGVLLGRG
jgi:hypothetical protein